MHRFRGSQTVAAAFARSPHKGGLFISPSSQAYAACWWLGDLPCSIAGRDPAGTSDRTSNGMGGKANSLLVDTRTYKGGFPQFLKFALIGRNYFRGRFHRILKGFEFLVCLYGDPYSSYAGK